MNYDNRDHHDQNELLDNLEALSRQKALFGAPGGSLLGEEDDRWMLLDRNARIDLEVECWGRRLA